MAVTTLDAMAAGGIHDHLGGGFARYSTDAQWLVPHFEKMLYDQAGLLRAYLHGWQVTGRTTTSTWSPGIVAYVGRDLTSPEGGVYSAEDADSEGVEGNFYVWTPEQIAEAVAAATPVPAASRRVVAEAVIDWFGVTAGGNFEGSNHPAPTGRRPPPRRRLRSRRAGGSCWPPAAAGCAPGSTTRC